MDDPLGIVHVVLSLDVGGLERVVLDLIREGNLRGHRSSVLCLERRGALAPRAEAMGAAVTALGKPPGLRPWLVPRIASALRTLAPEVVHTHQIGALLYAGPAARRAGVPALVHTEHTNNLGTVRSPGRKARIWLLWSLAARRAGRFCCVSRDIAEAAIRSRAVPRRKVAVVANGVAARDGEAGDPAAVRAEFGIPAGAPLVGTVGRLAEVKRQDVLIRGFARLAERVPGAHLLLIGDGPEAGRLRELAGATGVGDRIHFAGYRPDARRCLAAMDVFALTSRMEGMPLAILEAWAEGVPVVSSAVGGVRTLITPGEDALLFESGDDAGLADAVGRILGDPDRAGRIGRAGRDRVAREFDAGVMFEAYEREYRALLGGVRHRAGGAGR